MTDLTDRQQAILDFVSSQIQAQGLPPTLAEIAAAFGFNQTRGAHKHLLALEAKGHLPLLPGKARGIRLAGRDRMRPSGRRCRCRCWAGSPPASRSAPTPGSDRATCWLDRRLFSPTPGLPAARCRAIR